MILAPARNQPPAYTEASSTIWTMTCISAAASTEASPMIWIWARGLANGAHEASVHDSGPGQPPAYTQGFVHDLSHALYPFRRRCRGLPHGPVPGM